MLEWLGRRREDPDAIFVSEVIESSIEELISAGKPLTYDLGGTASTSEVSATICKLVGNQLLSHYGSV